MRPGVLSFHGGAGIGVPLEGLPELGLEGPARTSAGSRPLHRAQLLWVSLVLPGEAQLGGDLAASQP